MYKKRGEMGHKDWKHKLKKKKKNPITETIVYKQ